MAILLSTTLLLFFRSIIQSSTVVSSVLSSRSIRVCTSCLSIMAYRAGLLSPMSLAICVYVLPSMSPCAICLARILFLRLRSDGVEVPFNEAWWIS